jgi:hypothetical protein
MDQELLLRDLKSIEGSLDGLLSDGMTRMKWFVSFGTLLYLIRDKKHGKPFETDIDISIVGEHNFKHINDSLLNNEFKQNTCIRDSVTDEVYFANYVSPHKLHLDLFMWFEAGQNYWHTYDYMGDAKDGIPSFYHFKSTPKFMFEKETIKYNWFEDMSSVKIPALYGTLLDYWYPNWFKPMPDFGVSLCDVIYEPKNCENLKENICSLV